MYVFMYVCMFLGVAVLLSPKSIFLIYAGFSTNPC